MFVELLTLDLLFPGAQSLKEKRYVVSGVKSRLRKRFNVSVAEVDYHDKWQRALLAVVMVARDKSAAQNECDHLVRFIEDDHRVQIADIIREFR